MVKPTLLILAAGMGSRYGGLKQIDQVGTSGETIIDYSVYDAIRAGFGKVVFVIRKDIEADFKAIFSNRFGDKIKVDYVLQEIDNVPTGISYSPERQKPWGTGHALLVAKDVIQENFCVINADDFYGLEAFQSIYTFLTSNEINKNQFAMVGYPIENTLSDNGSVSRGQCFIDEKNNLEKIIERTSIVKKEDAILYQAENETEEVLPKNTLVSMNFWGFHPAFFDALEADFKSFLAENSTNLKSEFFLPFVVDGLIQKKEAAVTVLSTNSKWMGVTYKEDKAIVVENMKGFIASNVYPAKLW